MVPPPMLPPKQKSKNHVEGEVREMDQDHLTVVLSMPFKAAVERASEVFRAHGFSVAPPLDLQGAFRERLGVPFRPYVLLRLHHEELALRALALSSRAGAVANCSVAVQGMDDGMAEVTALDPLSALVSAASVEEVEVSLIAAEMQERIVEAIEDLARPPAAPSTRGVTRRKA